MRLVKSDWYGLDHSAVAKKFGGSPTFVNYFCVNGEYPASAIYYCAKPNKRKGHKTYMLLTKSNDQWCVRGMSPKEMSKFRYQDAVHCLSCDDVIYSVNRHDFKYCSCHKVAIDGGRDYTKISFEVGANYKHVFLDLLTDSISETIPIHGIA